MVVTNTWLWCLARSELKALDGRMGLATIPMRFKPLLTAALLCACRASARVQIAPSGFTRSADGRFVAFVRPTPGRLVATSLGDEEATELWLAAADGSNARRLVVGPAADSVEHALAQHRYRDSTGSSDSIWLLRSDGKPLGVAADASLGIDAQLAKWRAAHVPPSSTDASIPAPSNERCG